MVLALIFFFSGFVFNSFFFFDDLGFGLFFFLVALVLTIFNFLVFILCFSFISFLALAENFLFGY